MTVWFATVEDSTGAIAQIMSVSDDLVPYQSAPSGYTLVEADGAVVASDPATFLDTYYYVDGAFTERAAIPYVVSATTAQANGTDEIGIVGLPDPCTVQITGVLQVPPTEVEGGEVVLTSDTPGHVQVLISAGAAYLPAAIDLEFTA